MSDQEKTNYKSVEEELEGCKKRRKELYGDTLALTQEVEQLRKELAKYQAAEANDPKGWKAIVERDELAAHIELLREYITATFDEYNSTGHIELITALKGGRLLIDEPATSLQSIITKAKEEERESIAKAFEESHNGADIEAEFVRNRPIDG